MNKDYYSNSNEYINRWVISYADFVTMLLALFMVMYAASSMGESKLKELNKSLEKTFTTTQTHTNVTNSQSEVNTPKTTDNKLSESDEIIAQLKSNKELQTSVNILKDKRGVVMRLNDNMLFDPGSAIIKTEAKAVLDEIAVSLSTLDNPIVIEGHTDSTPIKNEKYPSNWELSTARATNIISYLTQKHMLSPGKLSAVGYGEYMPIAKNDDFVGRSKNRRVDIIILSTDVKK